MQILHETTARIRCAYCGLDHKLRIKALLAKNGEVLITVEAESEGCDVLDNGTLLQ